MPTEGQKDITVGRLEGKIDSMISQLAEIHKAVYGNGQAGIESRLTRAEEKFILITEERAKSRQDIEKFVKSVSELEETLEKHMGNDNIHSVKGLLFRKDIILYIILTFIALHSLIPDTTSLWEIIRKIFGL